MHHFLKYTKHSAPVVISLVLLVTIFLAELAAMETLAFFPVLSHCSLALLDATAITALLVPVIYILVLKPLNNRMKEVTAAKLAIQNRTDHFEAMAQTANDAILTINQFGKIIFWNKTAEKLFGYSITEAVGNSLQIILPKDIQQKHDNFLQRATNNGHLNIGNKPISLTGSHKSGTNIPIELTLSMWKSDGSTFYTGIIRDTTEQLKAKQSEDKFKRGILEAPFPIMIHDEDGQVITINKAWTEQSGYTHKDIPTITDWTQKAFGTGQYAIKVYIDSLFQLNTRSDEGEYTVTTATGNQRIWECSSAPLGTTPDGRRMIITVSKDITERRNTEQLLAEQEVKLAKLTAQTPGMLYQFLKTADGHYKIPYASNSIASLFGCQPDDVKDNIEALLKVIHPEDLQHVIESIETSCKNLTPWQCDYRVQLPNKPTRWLYGQSNPERQPNGATMWHGYTMDITQNKETTLELQEAQRLAKLGSWIYDADTDELHCSAELCSIFGLDSKHSPFKLSEHCHLFKYESWKKLQETVRNMQNTGQPTELNLEVITTGGVHKWVVTRAEAKKASVNNRFSVIQGTTQDITNQKNLEQQLRQAQKMEAIGQLAGGVAHDFNNILASILLQLNMLQTNRQLPPNCLSELKDIELHARRAANLTRQLLLFSRQNDVDLKKVDIASTLSNLHKMLQRLIGENITLSYNNIGGNHYAKADESQLEQLVMNLCINSRDAMPNGGNLTIATYETNLNGTELLNNSPVKPGEYICISVNDTGSGMSPETLKHIYEPFFTTKEIGKGTGLGLSTVFGIIQKHNGYIDVISCVDIGTTFTIYLPSAKDMPSESASAINLNIVNGNETVLLVEDESHLRKIASRCLSNAGYNIIEASNGIEAQDLWTTHKNKISIMITDMVMPKAITGLQIAILFKHQKPDLKVIISSGYNSEQESRNKVKWITYLNKPYSVNDLTAIVRNCLDASN